MKKGILAVLLLGITLVFSACNSDKNDMNKDNMNAKDTMKSKMSNTNTEMKDSNMSSEDMTKK